MDTLLVQQKYALEVVQKYGIGGSKTVSTPFEPGSLLGVEGCPKFEKERAQWLGYVLNKVHSA